MTWRSRIDGQSAEGLVARALERIGPMQEAVKPPASVMARYAATAGLPDLLLDLWEHHGIGDLAAVIPEAPETALVLRDGLHVEVLQTPRAAGVFIASLKRGETLGAAAAAALTFDPEFDAALPLTLLIQKGAITALHSSRRTS